MIVSVPILLPADAGAKVILMVQDAPDATLGSQLLVWTKSPVTATPEIASAREPLLDNVAALGLLVVPTSWDSKLRLVGESPAKEVRIPNTPTPLVVPT